VVADASEVVVIAKGAGGGAATLSVSDLLALCAGEPESVTVTVNDKPPL
jgi:hypothetical protein